jgi:hypothetical protein
VICALLASLVLAAAPVTVDKAARRVTFTARATDVSTNTPLEFLFVGPGSDRAYEALFVTEARLEDIVRAMESAGFPRGRPIGTAACRFWPAGPRVTLTPDVRTLLRDARGADFLPVTATGGARDAAGNLLAETNMPAAFFALYSCGQSVLLFDDALDQSEVYGRFTAATPFPEGTRRTFTLTWDGVSATRPYRLTLRPGTLKASLEALRAASAAAPDGLDVTVDFSPDLTVGEAAAAARALAVLDSRAVRLNGFVDGRFFYRAFLPLEKWRDRKERLSQPLEVRVTADGVSYTLVDEDWSGEGLDPKLTPRTVDLAQAVRAATDTCLLFAPASTPLARLYAVRAALPVTVVNWYVYAD